ncbi:MAG TPA: putative peptidoglycan glycosyltransferase FtsW [Candidatus Paceibacterota bacterium]|nr:putative peptidoglycan glycosyltransferase FtsW [Candidatus Paceibacterota bacterium]
MRKGKMDTPLFVSIMLLVVAGFIIFLSASLGLLARDSAHFGSIAFKQIFFGLVPGLVGLYVFSRIDYLKWRKASFWIFVGAVLLNLIIFIPGLGLRHGGAIRWLLIGSFSFQTSEVLKIGAVMYFAAWLSFVKDKASDFKKGFIPLIVMLGITGILCLLEPDTDTYIVIASSLVAMFVAAGGKWKHIVSLALAGLLGLTLLAFTRPYVMARIKTFMDPSAASQTSGYQIQQSLIAIGSGGVTGRGFGQSIQKFNYLPEPVGDSIFAVAAEEFGLIGATALIGLFVFFALRTLKIALNAEHQFGTLLAVGTAAFIIAQSFTNIGSMAGVLPLSGVPLLFVSQGGTALLFVLAESGILLNISRTARVGKRI